MSKVVVVTQSDQCESGISLKRFKNEMIYGISTALSSTAFFVYSGGLAEFNWSINLFWFSAFSALFLRYGYSRLSSAIYPRERLRSIKEALRNNRMALFVLVVSGILPYCIMLPLLTDQRAAMFFLLASCLLSVVKIPVGKSIFADRYEYVGLFWIGFFILIAGTLLYEMNPETFGFRNPQLVLPAMVVFGSFLIGLVVERYITTPVGNREQFTKLPCISSSYVTVETARLFVESTKCLSALCFALWFVFSQDLTFKDFIPSSSFAFFSLFWLGVPVTLCGTLARQANNRIGDTVASSIDGSRPLLGMVFILVLGFMFPNLGERITWLKVAGAFIASAGMLICLRAKPSRNTT